MRMNELCICIACQVFTTNQMICMHSRLCSLFKFWTPPKVRRQKCKRFACFLRTRSIFWYSSFNVFSFGNIGTAHAQKVHTSAYALHRFLHVFHFSVFWNICRTYAQTRCTFLIFCLFFNSFHCFWASANISYARLQNWWIFVCLFLRLENTGNRKCQYIHPQTHQTNPYAIWPYGHMIEWCCNTCDMKW